MNVKSIYARTDVRPSKNKDEALDCFHLSIRNAGAQPVAQWPLSEEKIPCIGAHGPEIDVLQICRELPGIYRQQTGIVSFASIMGKADSSIVVPSRGRPASSSRL